MRKVVNELPQGEPRAKTHMHFRLLLSRLLLIILQGEITNPILQHRVHSRWDSRCCKVTQGSRRYFSAERHGNSNNRNAACLMVIHPPFQRLDEPEPVTSLHIEGIPIREECGKVVLNGQPRPRRGVPTKLANVPVGTIPRKDTAP